MGMTGLNGVKQDRCMSFSTILITIPFNAGLLL